MPAAPEPSAAAATNAADPDGAWAGPTPELWQALGWAPDDSQRAQFIALQQQLREWNGRLNLTRLVEGADFWIAQVFDSLWPLLPLLRERPAAALRCIDVGTGGGFPGLAVAIALPNARLTLVDSVGRKTQAVQAMAEALGLAERVELRCERVERTGRQKRCRGQFDLALARAVASAPVVAEYLVPLLASGGEAMLYRGQWSAGDQTELDRALALLKARVSRREQRELPAGRGLRTALTLQATAPCPGQYPRAVGVPAKVPLGA
ncbi:16S rRNA (guanine(527)-N(7))-methyltransferase RsmG [Vulcanococcus limneticus]|uniref:16S rRNA (guanine(527)-N(7))-methyltransferase RsmG n=1 Tax=Vulcanococcus limneticus TaxID=2170428 RepID=UPI00398BBFB0